MVIFNEQSMLMADLLIGDSMGKPIEMCKRVTDCTLDIICGKSAPRDSSRRNEPSLCDAEPQGSPDNRCFCGSMSFPLQLNRL